MAKNISGSVGKGGNNIPVDVLVVQYLLNCVPSNEGGPYEELVLDGLCGQLTIGAIQCFQMTALGFADGRVDPGGQTIASLLGYDPYPNQKLTLPSGADAHKTGKMGGTSSTAAKDPWGYHNPASDNYMKGGKEPSESGGKSSMGGKSDGGGGSKSGGGTKFGGGKEGMGMGGGGSKMGGGKEGMGMGGGGSKMGGGKSSGSSTILGG
jgi:hypothetical protein